MAKTWVYADPHLGHANILAYCGRPWGNTEDMDRDLISLYNEVVGKRDVTYWLGDVTMKPPAKIGWLRRIIHKMHGEKVLVLGNHDTWRPKAYLECGFKSVHTSLDLDYGGRRIQMVHDPAVAQPNGNLWICGHLHQLAFKAPTHIAIVSVELTDYKPVLLSDIIDGYRPG